MIKCIMYAYTLKHHLCSQEHNQSVIFTVHGCVYINTIACDSDDVTQVNTWKHEHIVLLKHMYNPQWLNRHLHDVNYQYERLIVF